MSTIICRVVHQGEPVQVLSRHSDRQIWKCPITLREVGGMVADEFAATMMGNDAQCRYRDMDLVVATLRFTTHEYEGRTYQDVLVTDIVKIA